MFFFANLFGALSEALRGCVAARFSDVVDRAFLLGGFRQRRRCQHTHNQVIEIASPYVEFSRTPPPPLHIIGRCSVISTTNGPRRLLSLGKPVPREWRRALSVCGCSSY